MNRIEYKIKTEFVIFLRSPKAQDFRVTLLDPGNVP